VNLFANMATLEHALTKTKIVEQRLVAVSPGGSVVKK